jgi:hypothetical protein
MDRADLKKGMKVRVISKGAGAAKWKDFLDEVAEPVGTIQNLDPNSTTWPEAVYIGFKPRLRGGEEQYLFIPEDIIQFNITKNEEWFQMSKEDS